MKSAGVVSDPDILGGIPVFAGTDVPVRTIFGNLAEGASLDEILEMYPTLKREQIVEVLREADAAIESAVSPSGVAKSEDALLQQLRIEVQQGLDEADRGELLDEKEVWGRLHQRSEQLKRGHVE
ncbi:MAG TPA: DUF433 domain-containing protein [Candidatus Cybelea sp.]|nr:DUF433 domain-containing protein [Candidatus Cybelea sp.]